jgi:hypothetical protein
VAIEPRKDTTRTPTRLTCAEGNMDRDASASPCSVRRGRRPHGTPRNFMHENRETSEIPVANLSDRTAGEGSGCTARVHVCEGSHRGIVPMSHSNKDGASSAESEEGRLRLKENTLSSDTHPTQRGTACVPRMGECADKRHIGRYSSARRTGCAKERPSGSVRGVSRE